MQPDDRQVDYEANNVKTRCLEVILPSTYSRFYLFIFKLSWFDPNQIVEADQAEWFQ